MGVCKQLYRRHVKQGSVPISTDKTSAAVQQPFLGNSLEERPIKKPQQRHVIFRGIENVTYEVRLKELICLV